MDYEEWFEDDRHETLAICRSLAFARAASSGWELVGGSITSSGGKS
jgi:hypothetical protein